MRKDIPAPYFSVTGEVMQGKKLGRKLGFPTANLRRPEADNLPPDGVHAARITILTGALAGRSYPCVLNQGAQPTAPIGFKTVEAHIPDFSYDLYGETVRVDYMAFLRPERRFDDLDALKAQITADARNARDFFEALSPDGGC